MTEQRCCRISRDHRCLQHRTQEVTSLKRQTKQNVIGNVHLKSAVTGSKSVIKTKNEQVVGRNIYQRARPCKGAKLTPGLWIGGTKEVRTHEVMILVDTGGAQP